MSNEKTETAPAALMSLADLDLRTDATYEFEYVGPNGAGTGIFFTVLSESSATVTTQSNILFNERRRMEAVRDANSMAPGDSITPIEDDVSFGQRLAAIRLVGWRGIREEYTPERGLQLCRTNPKASAQIMAKSRQLENFTKA